MAFHSEIDVGCEAIGLAELSGISISINTVIKHRSNQKENPKPHESKEELTQKVDDFTVLLGLHWYVHVKVGYWTDKENNDLHDELIINSLLVFINAITVIAYHYFVVLIVNMRFLVSFEVLVQPLYLVVVSHDQTSHSQKCRNQNDEPNNVG